MKNISILFLIIMYFSGNIYAQEICDNAIDDDGDGFVDLNDDECICSGIDYASGLIPNPSFEDTLCCPTGPGELSCAESWIQANGATVDHYVLCDGVDWAFTWGGMVPSLPLPGDGYACLGFHSVEYVGTCLGEVMVADEPYVLHFYISSYDYEDPYQLAIYGTPNCTDLPFDDFCPTEYGDWIELDAQTVTPLVDGEWVELVYTFSSPVDIEAIAIGAVCGEPLPVYHFIDEILLISEDHYYGVESEGGWCSDDLIVYAETDTFGGYWQWYKDGIALLGETSVSLNPIPYGEGDFAGVYYLGGYCEYVTYSSPITDVTADFVADPICFYGISEFENTSIYVGEGFTEFYEWDFDDGSGDILESPTHGYFSPGDYMVSLVAKSGDSTCNDTLNQMYTVYPSPLPDIIIESEGLILHFGNYTVCANNAVNFSDGVELALPYEVVEWYWDFGDGETSAEENPTHFYEEYGIYELTVHVVTNTGCEGTDIMTVYVTEISPDFTVENECVFDEANFVNTSTVIVPTILDTYQWFMGDGIELTTEDVDYTYTLPGEYSVMLVATSTSGCRDTIEKFIEIYPLPIADFEFVVDGVSSEDGGTGGCYTSSVQFNDLSTIDIPSVLDSWLWDFGDGETSILPNPEHLYESEGVYSVSLTVISSFGCEETVLMDIVMTNGLAFLSSDTTICQNGTASVFAESSDGGSYSYDWSIPGTDDSPNQVIDDLEFSQWIYVTATNEAGCISPVDSLFITILDPIMATISDNDSICQGESVLVSTMTTGGDGFYVFNWTANGNPIPESTETISVSPDIETMYCATISDGCESDPVSFCTNIYVPPFPFFVADTTEGCEPTVILFTDLTGTDPLLNNTSWLINGDHLMGNSTAYFFEEAGSYDVQLNVEFPNGCISSNSISNFITIHPLPEPQFYATPNPTTYFNTEIDVVNIDPSAFASFEWLIPGGTPEWSASDSSVTVIYPELISGIYPVTLIETSEFGCIDSVIGKIEINNDQIIYASNTFTPDGNGFNDTWKIYIEGIDIYDFHLTLFDRWGEIIWESYNSSAEWNGTYGGSLVKDGTYVWTIEAKDKENDNTYTFNGFVNVLR